MSTFLKNIICPFHAYQLTNAWWLAGSFLNILPPEWPTSRTMDTQRLNPWFFATQIKIQIPNKYLGFEYKGLFFCRNDGWLIENMNKRLIIAKWVFISKSTKSFPNVQTFICPNWLPKPKSLVFRWIKASLGVLSLWPTSNFRQLDKLGLFGLLGLLSNVCLFR